VCEQQKRKYIGIELNPEYVELALHRIRNTDPLLILADHRRAQ